LLANVGIVTAVDNNNSDSNETFDKLMDMYIAREESKQQMEFNETLDINSLDITRTHPDVFEVRGKVPVTNSDLEREALSERYQQILENTKEEIINKYLSPNGPVIAWGLSVDNYLIVSILAGSEIDNETLDSLYQILEEEAIKVGIENVPVAFEYEEIPRDDEGFPSEESDIEIATDESENENQSDNTNSTSGFSALTLLLVFSILMWLRKE
jgi:hypothetical protein